MGCRSEEIKLATSPFTNMDAEIKVEVIHEETIIPSSPTPPHLESLSLSVFDQPFHPEIYVTLLLFYPSISTDDEVNLDHHTLAAERSNILKTSLSETLAHFYPFAGEFEYNSSISCNDHGAAFLYAQVNCPLSNVLETPDYGVLDQLLPPFTKSTRHLVLVQANYFDCGGMAIGVAISHKVADGFTFGTFIKSWAAVACGSGTIDHKALLAPEFGVTASLWPPLAILNSTQPVVEYVNKVKCVVKRFVFEASKIDALKSKVASCSNISNPTRVEVVSALIWKCVTEAVRSNTSYVKPSVLHQAVNMRKVLGLNSSVMGNTVGILTAAKTEETEANYQSLVTMLREGIENFKVKYGTGISEEGVSEFFTEYGRLLQSDDTDNYTCTSWCRFPFYETNFGWGKPSWVANPNVKAEHIILLIDTKDGGGIEATMSFKEEDMALIETNQELLAYASLDPAVI